MSCGFVRALVTALVLAAMWNPSLLAADFIRGDANSDGAVTIAKIATPTFDDGDFADDTLTGAALAANSVTATELADGAVDTGAFADGAVATTAIPDGSIDATELGADAVTDASVQDDALTARGLRAELDARNEKLNLKIREAELAKIPVMLVVGDQEVANGTVTPRRRHAAKGAAESVALDAFVAELSASVAERRE